ncbi:MAG: tRNA lysidine(34) synthetase TilS [Clostridia bacterium]|nr:tRNA lysidine(34) synthetase TilS [Clostridia bacterium]
MQKKVLKTIHKYNLINKGDKIVIGVSGGPDSICLLNILNSLKEKLNFEIVVAHINHMIREEADFETEYVKNFCKNIGVKCFVKKVNVTEIANKQKKGTEETGRKIRYNFFNEVLEKTSANKVATAHNSNDNAETVLMNIIRGSGLSRIKRNRAN